MIGHVDHGKTTLTKAFTGVWTDKHSEEIKRGISIRLGYADCEFYKCPKCSEPECYCTQKECPKCQAETKFLRRISFVDSPGHESLMATMLSGAAIMDGAILVVAANEKCPQPQTAEHLRALEILGVKNVVIAQNKVDLVSKEDAIKNQEEIREYIKDSPIKDAPIVPIAAHYSLNIDALIKAIEEHIPTPKRDPSENPRMYVARSFDVNKPGTQPDELRGGIVGGSLMYGSLKVGDTIELKPGIKSKDAYQPIQTKVVSLSTGGENFEKAHCGGLLGIGTELDPYLTKSDNLSGNMVGHPNTLPEVHDTLEIDVHLFNKVIGDAESSDVKPIQKNEPLMLSIGSTMTVGVVADPKKCQLKLKLPVCTEKGSKAAFSRRFGARWRLIGYGVIK